MKLKLFSALAAVAALADARIVQACAVCITGANDPTAEAFNASVLFLMATPYLVVGSIAGGLYFIYRRALAKTARDEAAEAALQLTWNQEASER
ncbi:MAG: hypothetical protein EXR70_24055 [Deltaproteobacteria bacterium]|nr:hypothetical protein [Deltaproteobacteria bacterium]